MKKNLLTCADCSEDNSILTQISSSPDVILLCNYCYNLKYSRETQNEIFYVEEEKTNMK